MRKYILIILILVTTSLCLFAKNEEGAESKSELLFMSYENDLESLIVSLVKAFEKEQSVELEYYSEGAGSDQGIAGVLNGLYDIAFSTSSLKSDDKKQGIKEIPVGKNGLVVIVNKELDKDSISLDDLASIYLGEKRKWHLEDKSKQKIMVFNQPKGRFLRDAFYQTALKGVYGNDARFHFRCKSCAKSEYSLAEMVSKTPYSIGYISYIDYMAIEKENLINALAVNKVECSPSNIYNDSYRLSYTIYIVTVSQPRKAVRDFIDFVAGDRGQRIVQNNNFLPLR